MSTKLSAVKKIKTTSTKKKEVVSAPTSKSRVKKTPPVNNKKAAKKTTLIIQYDVGFKNTLFIRGQGNSQLSWEKGLALKNVKNDEWVWESEQPFTSCEFKVLINDLFTS